MTRLVTFADVDDQADDQISVSARHEVELADGSRVLLLNDRGWSASGPPNIWAATSVEDIQETTRAVVGPDEPFGDRSQEDMEADHWASVQQIAQRQGVVMDAAEFRQLPHDVVLSPRLLAYIGRGPLGISATAVGSAPAGAEEPTGPRAGAPYVPSKGAVPGIAPPGADKTAVYVDCGGQGISHGQEPEPGHP